MEYIDENLYISDEDDEINRVGNVPLHWYDEFDHQGYTIDGERLKKLLNKSGKFNRRCIFSINWKKFNLTFF